MGKVPTKNCPKAGSNKGGGKEPGNNRRQSCVCVCAMARGEGVKRKVKVKGQQGGWGVRNKNQTVNNVKGNKVGK